MTDNGSEQSIEVVQSDRYDAPALEWQFAEIERLKAILAAAGVMDLAVQRKVCEEYFFDSAMTLDGSPFSVEEEQFMARIAIVADDAILLPPPEFEFHDYAFGSVAEAFGE